MEKDKGNYRSIFKATAILGGVQLFNILIGVVRNKIVSLLLGPTGMGIIGLLQSSTQTVSGFTNCGVSSSSVKNVAQAYEDNDFSLLGKVIYSLKRLIACTGTLAILVMLILCKQLSQWSFGNNDFAVSFACLSISLLLTQATNAYQTIIKGCRRVNYYAKSNVFGNFCSLLIAVPLYYVWGKDAIVPVLILVSASTFIFAYLYERKVGIKEVHATKEELKTISVDILKMGIPLALSEVFPLVSSYLIRIFVSSHGGVADVGLYTAGFAILNGYVGMIFTAMSSDYIPRLSAIVVDNKECEATINSQILLSILILFPILAVLIPLSKFIVWVLYSDAFIAISGMICWGALGMIVKTYNWCYGCILIPKRDSSPYFIFSVISAFFFYGISILFYHIWGLTGLGGGFLASHACDFIISYIFISSKYRIRLYKSLLIKLFTFSMTLLIMIVLTTLFEPSIWVYLVELLIVFGVALYAFKKLNQIIDISEFFKNKFKRVK